MNHFFPYKTKVDKLLLNFLCNMNQPFSYKTQSDKLRCISSLSVCNGNRTQPFSQCGQMIELCCENLLYGTFDCCYHVTYGSYNVTYAF